MASKRNSYLDQGISDQSDDASEGYDSEAAEISKSSRAGHVKPLSKKRKLSEDEDSQDSDSEEDGKETKPTRSVGARNSPRSPSEDKDSNYETSLGKASRSATNHERNLDRSDTQPTKEHITHPTKNKSSRETKETKPGVIYLSSLPPYLKPSALRNVLTQRGFSPITRLFLAPASKSRRTSRKMYTEGWVEFASKKTAKRCVEGLNAMPFGGKKGGFYHDDLWNMKYLKGMAWSELMAGIREERREEEGRRDEERRTIARETKAFVEGVEQGKKLQGMQRKKKAKKDRDGDDQNLDENDIKRTWRQYEVKGQKAESGSPAGGIKGSARKTSGLDEDVRQVLGKIF